MKAASRKEITAERLFAAKVQAADWSDEMETTKMKLAYYQQSIEGLEQDARLTIVRGLEAQIEALQVAKPETMLPMARGNRDALTLDLQLLILDLADWFGAEVLAKRCEALADMIIGEFGGLVLDDVAVAFAQAKSGKFGTVYGSLTPDKVCGWIRKYREELQQINQDYQEALYNRHAGHDGSARTNPVSERDEMSTAFREAKVKMINSGHKFDFTAPAQNGAGGQ